MEYTREHYLISNDKGKLDVDVIHEFLSKRSYWATGRSREIVERSIANSLCFGVYDTDAKQQVGFARVVTDFAIFAYIADVFILEPYRGRGLSKWLIESIRAHPDLQHLGRWLLATKDAHEWYRQFGFHELEAPERWMQVRRHSPT